jgi:hypothetical protein
MTSSKGLGKILALGAGIVVSSFLAEKAYSQDETRYFNNVEIGILLETNRINYSDIVAHPNGKFTIEKKKETANSEKKAEEKKVEEKKAETEKQDKKRFGIDLKAYLFSDSDGNKSNTTGVGLGCDADFVASKKIFGAVIGTYAKGKVDYNEAMSSYGSDSTSKLDSLTSKFNIPLLMKIKKGLYLGAGAQLESLIASIYANRSDNTIIHAENYSGNTANLLIAGEKMNLNAYFGNISGTVEDKVNNTSVKRDVDGLSYGLELIYKMKNKKKIITEIEGGKKGEYDSTGLKIVYGKDNFRYGLGFNSVSGNNYNNSQMKIYLSQRFGRKQ